MHTDSVLSRAPRIAISSISQTGLRIRYNSSNTPSNAERKPLAQSDPSHVVSNGSTAVEPSKPKSLIARLTASMSLKGAATTGETGHSSVAKLVELAKPESRQLAIAVGLVRIFLR